MVGSKEGVWTPSWEKESGVRFRISIRWVWRVGRFARMLCAGDRAEVERLRGVKGDRGKVGGGSRASWEEKSCRMLGIGKYEWGIKL